MVVNAIIGTAETTILAPSSLSFASVTLTFCNTSATSDEIVEVFVIPSGGGAGAAGNTILSALSIPMKETFLFDSKLILSVGDKLSAKGLTGGLVTVTASYMPLKG